MRKEESALATDFSRTHQQAVDIWLRPHCERTGTPLESVRLFVVILHPEMVSHGRQKTEVFVNEEVNGKIIAEIPHRSLENFTTVERVVLSPEARIGREDCGYYIAIDIGGQLVIGADFKQNQRSSMMHIEKAQEFLSSAEDAASCGRLSVAIDNVYSAAELAVKAVCLRLFPNKRWYGKHQAVTSKSAMAERNGQLPSGTHKLLCELCKLRKAYRYLEVEDTAKEADITVLICRVSSLVAFVVVHTST